MPVGKGRPGSQAAEPLAALRGEGGIWRGTDSRTPPRPKPLPGARRDACP